VVPDWLRRRFTMADEQQDSDALKKLTEENAILEQQIQLFTKRQDLAKLLFPTIPGGLEGTFELKGDFAVEGTAAAYDSLKLIAQQWCCRLACTQGAIERLATLRCVGDEDFDRCVRREKEAINKELTGRTAVALRPIVILREQDINGLLDLQIFKQKLQELKSRLEAVLAAAPPTLGVTVDVLAVGSLAAIAPFIAPAVEAALSLVSLFKKNVEITNKTVDVDESALVAAVADELRISSGAQVVIYPAGFPPNLLDQESGLLAQFSEIDKLMEGLVQLIAQVTLGVSTAASKAERAGTEIKKLEAQISILEERIERLTKSGGSETEIRDLEEEVKTLQVGKAEQELQKVASERESREKAELLKSLRRLSEVVDDFRNKKLAADNPFSSSLPVLLKSEKLLKRLQDSREIHVMQLKLHHAGASTKSKTSFWGGAKVSVGGGAVASFILYELPAGEIVASGVYAGKRKMEPLDDKR
jgi:hypothetical protein